MPTQFALQIDMVKMFIPSHKFGAGLLYYDSQFFVLVQHESKALSYVLTVCALGAPVKFILPYPIELMSCEELHAILHLVLQAGNIMNAVSPKVHLLY